MCHANVRFVPLQCGHTPDSRSLLEANRTSVRLKTWKRRLNNSPHVVDLVENFLKPDLDEYCLTVS